MKLSGTITAMVTPFANEKLDEKTLITHIHEQLDQGVDGILLLGITGESCTLTPAEEERIITLGVNEIQGKVPLIVGTGSNSTQVTIEKTQKAKDLGANAALVVTPYFNKPTQEGIYRHFSVVSQELDFPIIVYNHPGRSIVTIELPTLLKIVDLPSIVGIKDAAENLSQASDIFYTLKDKKPGFPVFSSDDISTFSLMSLGASGVISVASNLVPKRIVNMVNALLAKDFEHALNSHYELYPLFKALFLETNPIPIKTAMHLCGKCTAELRLPLCEMQDKYVKQLKRVLHDMHLIA